MKIKLIFICIWLFINYGCATPYEKNGIAGGYEDFPMGKDKYHITVQGNGYVNSGTIEGYFYRRAGEIT
jgi:hypothetical protein